MVSGRLRLRARGDRDRVRSGARLGREAGDAGDGVRKRLLVARQLHDADGDRDRWRIRCCLVAAGCGTHAQAGCDPEDGAGRGGVCGRVRDAFFAVVVGPLAGFHRTARARDCEARRCRLPRHRRRRIPGPGQRLGARVVIVRGVAASDQVVDSAGAAADHRCDSA
jgi:hypothetical protein